MKKSILNNIKYNVIHNNFERREKDEKKSEIFMMKNETNIDTLKFIQRFRNIFVNIVI
jgi:hypothetical protein